MTPRTESPPVPVRRVLVVDDSLSIQQAVREALAGTPGIRIIACGDVDRAESLLASEKPDVVFCDVVLPGRPGYDLCRMITLGKRDQRPPVFLLSGIFEPFDEERARAAGADAVITKPFRPEQIRQLLEKALASSAPPDGPAPPSGGDKVQDITTADLLPGRLPNELPPPAAATRARVDPQPVPAAARDGSGTEELVRRLMEPLAQRLVEPVAARVLGLLAGREQPLGDALGDIVRTTAERVVSRRLQELEDATNQETGHGGGAPSPD